MAGTFEQLLASHGYTVKQTTRILPPRKKPAGQRTGNQLHEVQRKAGDCWYYAAVPLMRLLFSKIDERYDALPKTPEYLRRKTALLSEVKSILNEHRNLIVECVLPLFEIKPRTASNALKDGEALPEADQHAHDYFVRNVYHMLVKTYFAWLPEFVAQESLEASRETLAGLAQSNTEKLDAELRSFAFQFRPVVTPT